MQLRIINLESWGPQILLQLNYFEGTKDNIWFPKALTHNWTHSGNNREQIFSILLLVIKQPNIKKWFLSLIFIQFTLFFDWNSNSMRSLHQNQKNWLVTPWGRPIVNNWLGSLQYLPSQMDPWRTRDFLLQLGTFGEETTRVILTHKRSFILVHTIVLLQ